MRLQNSHVLYAFLTLSIVLHGIAFFTWRVTETVARQAGGSLMLVLTPPPAPMDTAMPETQATKTETKTAIAENKLTRAQIAPLPTAKVSQLQPTETVTSSHDVDNHAPEQTSAKLAVTAATTTSTDAQGELGPRIQKQIQLALAPHFTYPLHARKKGWQGQVVLSLHIDHAGRLSDIHILHSSGYAVLDRAALSTMRHIASIPEAGQWLDRHGFDTEVPIDYRLADA